jgi:hypothetical protein
MLLQLGIVRMTTGEQMMTQEGSKAVKELPKQKNTRFLAQIVRKTTAVFRSST